MPTTAPTSLSGGAECVTLPVTALRHTDIKYKDDPITLSATAFLSANAYKLRASVTAYPSLCREHLQSCEV